MNSKIILKVGLSIEPQFVFSEASENCQVLTVDIECLIRSELVYLIFEQTIN